MYAIPVKGSLLLAYVEEEKRQLKLIYKNEVILLSLDERPTVDPLLCLLPLLFTWEEKDLLTHEAWFHDAMHPDILSSLEALPFVEETSATRCQGAYSYLFLRFYFVFKDRIDVPRFLHFLWRSLSSEGEKECHDPLGLKIFETYKMTFLKHLVSIQPSDPLIHHLRLHHRLSHPLARFLTTNLLLNVLMDQDISDQDTLNEIILKEGVPLPSEEEMFPLELSSIFPECVSEIDLFDLERVSFLAHFVY